MIQGRYNNINLDSVASKLDVVGSMFTLILASSYGSNSQVATTELTLKYRRITSNCEDLCHSFYIESIDSLDSHKFAMKLAKKNPAKAIKELVYVSK